MQKDKITWDLGNGKVIQILYTLNTEFDLDEIVKIDINNLMGEYLTAPVLFNTVANLRTAGMEALARKKLEIKIVENEIWKSFSSKKKDVKMTNLQIQSEVETHPQFIEIKLELIESEKAASMLDNLYWAIKEKCQKLENLYHKITPDEFQKDIMEAQVNNVEIKIRNSLIK